MRTRCNKRRYDDDDDDDDAIIHETQDNDRQNSGLKHGYTATG